MSSEQQLQRQIGINLQLRRKLEAARRDVVEECAKFCGEHWPYPSDDTMGEWVLRPAPEHVIGHSGELYAKGLRAMINQGE